MNHVDFTALNIVSFCSGAGALDIGVNAALGAHGIGTRHVAYCEREAAPCAALRARMADQALESAPIWGGNLEEFPGRQFRGVVDAIAAGFPCQPHSAAGKKEGRNDERNLLPAILNQADSTGAWLLFLENVSGLKKEFDYIAGLLLQRGWNCEWGTLWASFVGANHRRDRWFCVAYRQHLPHGAERWLEQRRGSYTPALYGPMPGQPRGRILASGDDTHGGQHVPGREQIGGTAASGSGNDILANRPRGGCGSRGESSWTGGQPDRHHAQLGDTNQPGPQRRGHHAGKYASQRPFGPSGAGMVGNATGDEQPGHSNDSHGPGGTPGGPSGELENTHGGGCGKPDRAAPAIGHPDPGLVRGSEGVADAGRAGSRGSADAPDVHGEPAPENTGRTNHPVANGSRGIHEWNGTWTEGGGGQYPNGGHELGNATGPGQFEHGGPQWILCDQLESGGGFDFPGIPVFAPGPNNPDWLRILAACPWLAPALPISPVAMRETWGAIFRGTEMEIEPGLCGVADGLESPMGRALCLESSRADMLRITGNGVVWQQAAWAYFQILDRIFSQPSPS